MEIITKIKTNYRQTYIKIKLMILENISFIKKYIQKKNKSHAQIPPKRNLAIMIILMNNWRD